MTTSKSWALMVVGYSILAAAMVAFVTINGVSSTTLGTVGTAALLGLGLLLPTAGLLGLARLMGPGRTVSRNGLVLQSLGLIGILIGLVISFVAGQVESSTPGELARSIAGYAIAGMLIVLSGASGLVGAIYLSRKMEAGYLSVGLALIALGAALIPASNIALRQYWISDTGNHIFEDVGATIAACGCVVAACACFVLRSRPGVPPTPESDRRSRTTIRRPST